MAKIEFAWVLTTVGTPGELLSEVDRLRPDVVLTDIRMPPGHSMEGIVAAHSIRMKAPEVGVVVLSQYADAAYATELFRDGTEGLGYLLKVSIGDLDELLAALRAVAAGRSAVDPEVVARLVEQRVRSDESAIQTLSARELDVLREMAEGRTNAAIATRLHLSESGIEKVLGPGSAGQDCSRSAKTTTFSSNTLVRASSPPQVIRRRPAWSMLP